jgi:hypothetical protein
MAGAVAGGDQAPIVAIGHGAVTLGDLVGKLDRLEARCRHCERYGRVRLAKLIEEHGDDMGLPALAMRLAEECSKANSLNLSERCLFHFPSWLSYSRVAKAEMTECLIAERRPWWRRWSGKD